MKSRTLLAGLLGGLLALPLTAYPAFAWVSFENGHSCHTYVSFPFASNCTWHAGQGYDIEVASQDGWGTAWTSVGGRGVNLALSEKNHTLWTVAADGTIWAGATNTWPMTWSSKPLNACGTGATIPINQDNGIQILGVGIDGAGRDVPWVVDAYGTVRYWRTKYNPACWAALPAVPGPGTITSIGVYDHPSVQNDNLPWVTRGYNLYMYDGSQWILIDGATGTVSNNSNYVTGSDGRSLWTFDFAGHWTVDSRFNVNQSGPVVRLGSGPAPAFISWDNKVWWSGGWL